MSNMDNFDNMNQEEKAETIEELYVEQVPSGNRTEKPQKSHFFAGFLSGMLVVGLILLAVIEVYTRALGGYLILGGNGSNTTKANSAISSETAEKLDQLNAYIDLYSVNEINQETLDDKLSHALIDSLGDKYSAYFNPKEYEELMTSTTGTYYGIGAGLLQDKVSMQVTISKIYEGTPSEEAGLLKDDVILFVEDIDATTMELSELVQHIRGEEGTSVHIKIYRPSEEKEMEFDVERKNVVLPSVSSQMLDDTIGYIQVSDFQTNTPDQFEAAIAKLTDQGMKAMVIDLRSNPGGLVTSVVSMLDYILPEGVVVYTEDKYGKRTDYTSAESSKIDMPMVVLVDENSASASEIFAGAIKDFKYGTILGTTTFGKGIVQSIWPLQNGGAIKLTTAKYFTPSGVNIHGVGIEPDVELAYEFLGGEKDKYSVELDNQILKAMEILKASNAE